MYRLKSIRLICKLWFMIKAHLLKLTLVNLTVNFHHVRDWGEFLLFLFFQILLVYLELLLLLLLLLFLLGCHKVVVLLENGWIFSVSSWSRHSFFSFLLLNLILFSHSHGSISTFLTALLSLTHTFFRNLSDWLIRNVLLHTQWHHITLLTIFNISVFNINNTIDNLLMTVALAKIRI